jgi:ATP-dependent Lhr-like helicase
LWSQRLRAQSLLGVALQHPAFPIVLETYRECLHDVFDVPALTELLSQIRRREVRIAEVETARASPFARSLAFAYVAAYIYEGDAPLAERKAQALTLDRNLLRELLGQEELRDLLEPQAIADVEADLQALSPERRARHPDGVHDLLRRIGELGDDELALRTSGDAQAFCRELEQSGRALVLRIARQKRWVAIEDVAKYRDALGTAPPPGVAAAFLEPAPDALTALVARWARTHGPFTADGREPARRLGLLPAQVQPVLRALVAAGKLLEGEFRPGQSGAELCDPDVLRLIRRDTLARLRNEVAPVDAAVLARFLPRWHGIGGTRGGPGRLREAIDQLEGLPLPFSELERVILPGRVADYQPRMLDELGAAGELVWVGAGALGSDDGRVILYRREHVAALCDRSTSNDSSSNDTTSNELPSPLHREILTHLEQRGASFAAQLPAAQERPDEVVAALWELVWLGLVTNDTFAPLRSLGRVSRGPRHRFTLPAGGRWSALSTVVGTPPAETVRAHTRALVLLERYGVVSRAAAAAEELPGGFQSVAPVLRAMEAAGKIRRGHFVEGLEGAQFAHAAAVDRLRAARGGGDERQVVTLSAVDPANPYGALLPWPSDGDGNARGRRAAGARVVLVDGVPALFVERGGKKLRLGAPSDDATVAVALGELRRLAAARRHRQLRIEEVDGVPALHSPHAARLERSGFRVEPGALVLSADDERAS